jgi:hypothetical protein
MTTRAEIEAALAAITPGERYVERDDSDEDHEELGICYEVSAPGARDDSEDGMLVHIRENWTVRAKAEAELLAKAPAYLRWLLAALQERDELLGEAMLALRFGEHAALAGRIRALLERGGA